MTLAQKVVEDLRSLSPESEEFYERAAYYFRQRARSHRNYGRFFLFLACVSLTLIIIHWKRPLLAVSVVPGYFFCVALGLITISGSRRTLAILNAADQHPDSAQRMKQLRRAALSFEGDPVSVLVLKNTQAE